MTEEKDARADVLPDHRLVLDIVEPGATVLDLGCGDGTLLSLLVSEKNAKAQGIEIDEKAIYACVAKGLSVFHGDIDSGLKEYHDRCFDYVILNQSLQQVKNVEAVLLDALRVGKKVIVGFPNFAQLYSRCQMFFFGRSPVTPSLPYSWYNSPNLRFLSIRDFSDYCRKNGFRIERRVCLGKRGKVDLLPNLFAGSGLFVISR